MQPDTQPDGAPTPSTPSVSPAGQPPAPQQPSVPPIVPPVQQPTSAPQPVPFVDPAAAPAQEGFEYDPGSPEEDEYQEEIDLTEPVRWSAQEYIHQEKDAKWFILFGIVIVIFMAVAILLMQSWTFAVLLVVIAIMVVVLAKRPPRVMEYALSNEGLHIGETLHRFSDFKSFGVIRDGEEFSVMLIPRRRLQPGITVYFPEEAGEDIVDALGSRLPMRDLRLDVVDRLVRKLRL